MEKITIIQSTAVLVPAANIDTDQIIPARFLKTTSREGFGEKVADDVVTSWYLGYDEEALYWGVQLFDAKRGESPDRPLPTCDK